MLGTKLFILYLVAFVSGQGVSYYGSSNVRSQSRLAPRPLSSYRRTSPDAETIRPVYDPQPVYQPPQPRPADQLPVYLPPQEIQPDVSQPPSSSQRLPLQPPPRPVNSHPRPGLSAWSWSHPTQASLKATDSTPRDTQVVYPESSSAPPRYDPKADDIESPFEEETGVVLQPEVEEVPSQSIPEGSDIEVKPEPQLDPLPELPVSQPLPLRPVPIPGPEPSSEPQPPEPISKPNVAIDPMYQPPAPIEAIPPPVPEIMPEAETIPSPPIPENNLPDVEDNPQPEPAPYQPPRPNYQPLQPPRPSYQPLQPPAPIPIPAPYPPHPTQSPTLRPDYQPLQTLAPIPNPTPYPPHPTQPPAPIPSTLQPQTTPSYPVVSLMPNIPDQEVPIIPLADFQCNEGNAYYTIKNECDAYIECQQQKAWKHTCPDGLHFNPNAVYPAYPCAYPSEVRCESTAAKQIPRPTSECPNRYGFYSMSGGDCSKYIMCQEGKATVMNCPFGLVFNDQLSSCDWPENVPQCSLNAFEDFTCPISPVDDPDLLTRHRYGNDCGLYVACQHGHPRLLRCDKGMSFDENSQVCIDADLVKDCRSRQTKYY